MGFDKLSYCLPDGRTVLETSCALFVAHPAVDELVLVAGGNRSQCEAIAAACPKPCTVVQGGATRADSVHNGLAAAKGQLVAIHDAAALCQRGSHHPGLAGCRQDRRCRPGGAVKDTIKVADKDGKVVTTPDRATLYAVQTPQCFDRALYLQALEAVSGEESPAWSPMIAACLNWPACPSH